jgi:hypothetical protein
MDGLRILPEIPPLSSLNSLRFFPEVIVRDSIKSRVFDRNISGQICKKEQQISEINKILLISYLEASTTAEYRAWN